MKPTFSHQTALVIGVLIALVTSSAGMARADHWPAWRGAGGQGISNESGFPTQWSTDKNVVWRTPLPEPGNSTPIVWGDRVFLTQNISEGDRRSLMCLDRGTGNVLWTRGFEVPFDERTHRTNPYASSSPVTDGERVVCWFGSAGLTAFDFSGKELWRIDLGKHDHRFGYGGSPVIHQNQVFLNFGPGPREFLVAVDKYSGAELWRHRSPTPGEDDILGTWSTPFVVEAAGRAGKAIVISPLRGDLAALDASSGNVLWRTDAFGPQAKATPVVGEGVVVFSGDKESAEVAVALDNHGRLDADDLLWRRDPPKRRIATGVISQGHVYGVQTPGIADCVELRTGKVIWEERLRGKGSNNAVWASPVMGDGNLYVTNQSGDTFVWKADSSDFQLIAVNSVGETSNSTLALSNGQIFLRTHEALWCLGSD